MSRESYERKLAKKIEKVAGLVASGLASLQDGAINNALDTDGDFLEAEGELIKALALLGCQAATMEARTLPADRGDVGA